MAIASAVEKNGNVYIYNEKDGTMAVIPAGTGPKDGLMGYTSTTVSIRRGFYVNVYNEKGGIVNSIATS